MATVYDVPAADLIKEAAKDMKKTKKIAQPEWAKFVKTGVHVERRPEDPDWWFVRAASVLRKIYTNGPVGVSKLRTAYGGRKNKGVKPEHFKRSGGKIIRTISQNFDRLNFTKKTEKTHSQVPKGRIITSEGQSYLDKIATDIIVSEEKQKK